MRGLQENSRFAGSLRTNTEEKEITQQINYDFNSGFTPKGYQVDTQFQQEEMTCWYTERQKKEVGLLETNSGGKSHSIHSYCLCKGFGGSLGVKETRRLKDCMHAFESIPISLLGRKQMF